MYAVAVQPINNKVQQRCSLVVQQKKGNANVLQ